MKNQDLITEVILLKKEKIQKDNQLIKEKKKKTNYLVFSTSIILAISMLAGLIKTISLLLR